MSLCQPNVIGPLSELSASIRVQGQMTGAVVTIFSLKPSLHEVAKGVATSPDQRFPLLPGVQLHAGNLLVARQSLGGEESDMPAGDLGMGVQPKPHSAGDIGHVGFVSHLYTCGQYLWIGGAIPGADVAVADSIVIGNGTADEGTARFELTQALPSGIPVNARQSAPALPNGPDTTRTPDAIPIGPGQPLTPPVINLPVRGCDTSIEVSGVFDGALVSLLRGDGTIETAGFDRDTLWMGLASPLKEHEKLQIRQNVSRKCEHPDKWSDIVIVGPAKPVDPPIVQAPLCAGATRVQVSNLRQGAIVHISTNGKVFDIAIPSGSTSFNCTVPPLTGTTLSATQEVCGVVSDPFSVAVDPHEDNVPPAVIVGPLFACARSVSVNNVHKGATIQIFAKNVNGEGPISDLVNLYETQGTIPVSPYLHETDHVFAVQWACSDKGVHSAGVMVLPHPVLNLVTVLTPIFGGDTNVEVTGAIPGALVEVFAGHGDQPAHFAGSAVADTLHAITHVHLTHPLEARDRVSARQSLCDQMSRPSQPVSVVPAPEFGPRPFYIVGHNPNTIGDVLAALGDGANAIEPDVNVFEDDEGQLCISHSEGESGGPSLVQYLTDLHTVALQHPELALVVFDCKEKVATAQHGVTLLNAIRQNLTFDIPLNVIISVSNLGMTDIFTDIIGMLEPREGVMIDEENDPIAVSNFFTAAGAESQCYGNGISVLNSILGPNVRPSMERACEFRAALNRTRFIYVWTVQDADLLFEYIRIGVDGIITDDVGNLNGIAHDPQFQNVIRMATRADDPFRPANFAYGLQIHTGDVWMGGTDANITFTLTGSAGSVSKTVNTDWHGRMERNDWNYVTLQSSDLGALQSITVQRDNDGNAPDWFLDRITVESFRFGVTKLAVFNRWIDTTNPFTQPLV